MIFMLVVSWDVKGVVEEYRATGFEVLDSFVEGSV